MIHIHINMDNYAKESYKWSLAIAGLGMLLAIISIATPEWTVADGKVIGLWVLQSDGQDYSWTGTSEYSEGTYVNKYLIYICYSLLILCEM